MEHEPKDLLTTEDVAKYLGVKVPTVYKYVREGKLKPLHDHKWRMRQTKLFPIEQVEILKKDTVKPGVTVKEAAEQLGVSISTINNFIQDQSLPAFKKLFRGREIYFINKDELEKFSENHKPRKGKRRTKENFYIKDKGYMLFQLFVNSYTHEYARLIEINGEEGRLQTEKDEIISLDFAEKTGYVPHQKISTKNYISKKGYAKFIFSKPEHINSKIYVLIEMLCRAAGPKNIRIYDRNDKGIQVDVKSILLKNIDQTIMDVLNDSLFEGKTLTQPNGIYIDSDFETFIIHIPSKLKEFIKNKANKENKSMEEVAIEAFYDAWNLEE